jgi:hypothetical protein
MAVLGIPILTSISAICIFNFVKCVCIAITVCYFISQKETPLTILGDAIQSFLQNPDQTTKGLSIVSKKQLLAENRRLWKSPQPVEWTPAKTRWLRSATIIRWITCLTM